MDEVRHPALDRPGTLRYWLGWQRLDLREGADAAAAPQTLLSVRVREAGALAQSLALAGQRAQSAPLADATPRFYVEAPFGNRIEMIEIEGAQLAFAQPRRVTDLQISV